MKQEARNLKLIIDYTIAENNESLQIKDLRARRGAECDTDYILLLAKITFV